MAQLEFDLKKAIREIKKKKAHRVLLQFPEGLKQKSVSIARKIEEKTKAKTFTQIKPCYGACDIPIRERDLLQADLVLHFGHTKMLKTKNIQYLPLEYSVKERKLKKLCKKLAEKIKGEKFKKIGLSATAQFLGHLDFVKQEFEEKGFKVFIGKSKGLDRGQVLGCNTGTAGTVKEKVDCFVFVGDGLFHPKGVAFNTGKRVFLLNPLNESIGVVSEKEMDRMQRAHLLRVERAKNAQSYGVLVSTKPGQFNPKKALELKEKAEKKGKKALILVGDELREELLLGLGLDCFVNTACPRITLDDSKHWKQHLVSGKEMEKALE